MSTTGRLIGAAALGAVILAAAAPASAMSGACLWDHLRPQTRDALVGGYMKLGPEVLERVYISDQEFADVDRACDPDRRTDERLKDRLLSAVVFEHGSAVFLKQRMRWRDSDIQGGWSRILPADLARIRRSADTILSDRDPVNDDLSDPVHAFLGPGADEALTDQARGYLTSRAIREAIEQRG